MTQKLEIHAHEGLSFTIQEIKERITNPIHLIYFLRNKCPSFE